jgi:hypothetical protein
VRWICSHEIGKEWFDVFSVVFALAKKGIDYEKELDGNENDICRACRACGSHLRGDYVGKI